MATETLFKGWLLVRHLRGMGELVDTTREDRPDIGCIHIEAGKDGSEDMRFVSSNGMVAGVLNVRPRRVGDPDAEVRASWLGSSVFNLPWLKIKGVLPKADVKGVPARVGVQIDQPEVGPAEAILTYRDQELLRLPLDVPTYPDFFAIRAKERSAAERVEFDMHQLERFGKAFKIMFGEEQDRYDPHPVLNMIIVTTPDARPMYVRHRKTPTGEEFVGMMMPLYCFDKNLLVPPFPTWWPVPLAAPAPATSAGAEPVAAKE